MKLRKKILDECEIIRDNCEYNGETHYGSAKRVKTYKFWFEVVPAMVAALTSTLIVSGISPPDLIWLTAVSSILTAIATIFDPSKRYMDFNTAGHLYTILKHKARFLKDVKSLALSDVELMKAVQILQNEYFELIKTMPLTEEDMFKKARKKIKEGIHLPDYLTNKFPTH